MNQANSDDLRGQNFGIADSRADGEVNDPRIQSETVLPFA